MWGSKIKIKIKSKSKRGPGHADAAGAWRCEDPLLVLAVLNNKRRFLVTGGDGLLAFALKQRTAPEEDWHFLGRGEFDLTAPAQMAARLDAVKPNVVINTAAYNLVDRCETERELSWAVNATGPEQLAQLCAQRSIKLVHYGTDYVFDGLKKAPYVESDPPNPLNHYAAGKLAGEQAVLRASPDHLVLRTSWVFGWHPTQTKTFVHTMVKAAREGRQIRAARDQFSAPTYAADLAQWTEELARRDAQGVFHAVNDSAVSRLEWTQIILAEAAKARVIESAPLIESVESAFFNSTMRRPDYSVLSNEKMSAFLGHRAGDWVAGLRKMLAEMRRI